MIYCIASKSFLIKFFRSFLLITIVCDGHLASQAQNSPRKKINIDGNWKFHYGHAANPEKDFNYSIDPAFSKSGSDVGTVADVTFADSTWRTLDLPHDWAVELPFVHENNLSVESHGFKPVGGLFPETSIGWYRKHFTVSEADSGIRFQVQFDGIYRNANIWFNGFYLGNNASGYLGAVYDITDYVSYQGDNVLVVRVDATQYEGWFYEGAGIYRHVWLNEYDNLHVIENGLFVSSNVKGKTASVSIETTVRNESLGQTKCTVFSYITNREGKLVAQSKSLPLYLTLNSEATVKQNITINRAMLWSIEDPYLYRVTSVVRSVNITNDSVCERFGIRTFRFDPDQGFFLNGKPVKILGANNHQDHAGVGTAIPDQLQFYRIRLLKEMGVNAYRASHNAPTPELIDVCDSLGMLVLDENRLLNSSPEYISQFERLILRDRNHPSVFLWSIGNEEDRIQTNSYGKRIAQSLIARQKKLDPSRLSTYAADVANVFHGVNEVVPIRGFNYSHSGIDGYHRDHPQQPIIGTEMGSTVSTRGIYEKDSIRAYLPDLDVTAPYWATTAEAWWKPAAEKRYWMGGFIWTGFDYRGEPTPYKWPNISSHFGVMDVCGFPKNIYYYYQSWWTDKDVLHISPHWNWKEKTGQPIDVWVNTNGDSVELFLNKKSLGQKNMPRNGHLEWKVVYQPGVLEAIAYKRGKKITSKVETTSEPTKVVLSPDKFNLVSDGKDVIVINITVIDKEGRKVPDANNMIDFSIFGPGKIIGVGNGDPSSHESDKCLDGPWQRSLFNGKCQVIIQSNGTAGVINLKAKSAGLSVGSTDIHAVSH